MQKLPAAASLGRIAAMLLLLAILAAAWYVFYISQRERVARMELTRLREEIRMRGEETKLWRAGMQARLDSLIVRVDSLIGEIDGLRLSGRQQRDSILARKAELRKLRDSLQAIRFEPLPQPRANGAPPPDTCCSKIETLAAGFMAAQGDIRRLRAEHDIRVLFILDAYASLRTCAADAGAACSKLRRRIIDAFDSAAARAGWEMRYCDADRKIFAVDAVDGCQSIKIFKERWGLTNESAYLLGMTLAPDPCAVSREEMQLLAKHCVGRLRVDTLICDSGVRRFAAEYLSATFVKELRQRIAR